MDFHSTSIHNKSWAEFFTDDKRQSPFPPGAHEIGGERISNPKTERQQTGAVSTETKSGGMLTQCSGVRAGHRDEELEKMS